jgi:hypothetical protein
VLKIHLRFVSLTILPVSITESKADDTLHNAPLPVSLDPPPPKSGNILSQWAQLDDIMNFGSKYDPWMIPTGDHGTRSGIKTTNHANT